MADLKISALTSATTPLAGTEVLPIVQSSTTKKVAISDVTAGRSVSVGDLTLTTGGAITTASEAYDYRYSSGGVGSNARVRYRTVYSGGGSGYGGSFELESRTSSNVWNTGAFSVTDAGNVSTTGNLIIATSGKGIDFSATSGSGTSELFSDYEEGTFTATLTADTPPSSSLTTTGHYTKVGRLVTVMIDFSNYDTTGAAGTYYMTGLPFTSANNGTINYGVLASFNFSTEPGCAAITANTSQIILASTYGASLSTAAAGAGKYIRATITYIAA